MSKELIFEALIKAHKASLIKLVRYVYVVGELPGLWREIRSNI